MKNRKSQSPRRGSSVGQKSARYQQSRSATFSYLLRRRTTAAEFEPIKRKLVAGLSVPEIVREEAHERQVLARKEQQWDSGYSINELAELKSEVMDITIRALRKKPDMASTLQVCRLLRGVPTRGELEARRTADPAQQFEAYKRLCATQLGRVALHKNRVYGTELPIPQNELDERVRKAMAEENARKTQDPNPPDLQSAVRADDGNRHNGNEPLARSPRRTTAAEFGSIRGKLIAGMPISQIVREEEQERRTAQARHSGCSYSADDLADLKTDALHLAVSELREKEDPRSAVRVWQLLRTVPTPGEVALASSDPSHQVDPYTMCAATQLGLIALERAGANQNGLPVPHEEIENRAEKSLQEANACAADQVETAGPLFSEPDDPEPELGRGRPL